ncbi:MAG TPA: hypothetical protein VD963_10765 [Phycisphaerales bacterium]|nr:hypothetical protein [Phycisphaerales bacterium]
MISQAGIAFATPINPGQSAFITHPSVPDTPKYTQGLPAYFTPGNIVGTLSNAAITGGIAGTVTTTVYRNPATNNLTFQYVFNASGNNPVPVARATIGGQWLGLAVTDAGSDTSGDSGTGDPGAEWTDGRPMFLARSPDDHAPSVQWLAFGIGAGLGATDASARIWFETNAQTFAQAPVAWIDTALTGQGTVLAPAIIPLPNAAGLGALGLGLVAMYVRRRQKNN